MDAAPTTPRTGIVPDSNVIAYDADNEVWRGASVNLGLTASGDSAEAAGANLLVGYDELAVSLAVDGKTVEEYQDEQQQQVTVSAGS